MVRAVVLGAGVTGLSCAWKLSERMPVSVIEKSGGVGGLSSCFCYKDMRLDYGPHKVYTQKKELLDDVLSLFSPDEMLAIEKKSRIRLDGKFYSFPVKISELLLKMNPLVTGRIGLGYLGSMAFGKKKEGSYEEYIRSRFGGGLYDLVFGPLASKVWGEPSGLSEELARTRVAMPSLLDMAKRAAMGDGGKPEISAKLFHYPKNGIREIPEKMRERTIENGGKVSLGLEAERIKIEGGKAGAVIAKKKEIPCSHLVSTIPLEEMVGRISPDPPESVLKASERLVHRNLILAVLVINKDRIFADNWLFFPEKKYMFNRVYEQKGFSQHMVLGSRTALCCEITCEPGGEMWGAEDEEIVSEASSQLEEAGLIKKEEVADSTVVRVPKAYPIYTKGYGKNLEEIMDYADEIENIYPIGRNGSFNYIGLMDGVDIGMKTASHILSKGKRAEWKELRKQFRIYITVD